MLKACVYGITYGHSSRPRDLTLDKCVPKFLCIPEHSIQINVPKLRLAHSGPANISITFEPQCEKTGLQGFRPGPTQTGLYSHRRWLEA